MQEGERGEKAPFQGNLQKEKAEEGRRVSEIPLHVSLFRIYDEETRRGRILGQSVFFKARKGKGKPMISKKFVHLAAASSPSSSSCVGFV